jgi:hypothetical protein
LQAIPEVIGSVNPRKGPVGSKLAIDLIFESFNPEVTWITILRTSDNVNAHREKYVVSPDNRISFQLPTTGWKPGEYGLEVRSTITSGSGSRPPAMYATRFYLF